MKCARPHEGTAPGDLKERMYAPVQVDGDVPLLAGSNPAPRYTVKYYQWRRSG